MLQWIKNLSDVKSIIGGRYNSLAFKKDGTVWAWGSDSNGQLGNNGTTNSPIPIEVQGLDFRN